jgi:hypothetical protein
MSKERILTSELWSVQEELQSEIREILAQPEPAPEPVAWRKWDGYGFLLREYDNGGEPLFKSPQSVKLRSYAQAEEDLKREPLSEGELNSLYYQATNQTLREQDTRLAFGFARAIEKAHCIGVDNENHDA